MKYRAPHDGRRFCFGPSLKHFIPLAFCVVSLPVWALDGTWLSASGGGNWEDSAKWVDNNIAGGIGSTATLDGAAGRSIYLTAPVTVGHIAVTNWSATTWWIGDNLLTLDAGGSKPTISHPELDSLWIASSIGGNNGFEKLGGGRLYLNGNNVFTGEVIFSGGTIQTAGPAAFNATTPNTVILNSGQWLVDGYAASYNNNIVMASEWNSGFVFAGSEGSAYTFGGIISESGDTRHLTLGTNGSSVSATLQGDNSYTGNTVIGSTHDYGGVVLRVEHENALGTGTAEVTFVPGGSKTHDRDGLEILGGITVANKTLTLRGRGKDEAGSLRSVGGDNVWSGGVNIGDFGAARIGVDADTLTVSGQISGSGAGGLTKVGDGTLVLTNDNSYANGTIITAGTLLAGHNNAVAGGDVLLGDGTGVDTLRIGSEIALAISDLTLESSAHLAFDLMADFDATRIVVSGDQFGSDVYTVDIFNGGGFAAGTYTLLTVQGAFEASNFVLGVLPAGYEASTLDWSGGALVLHAAAIPEPSTWLLLGLASGAIALLRRKSCATSV